MNTIRTPQTSLSQYLNCTFVLYSLAVYFFSPIRNRSIIKYIHGVFSQLFLLICFILYVFLYENYHSLSLFMLLSHIQEPCMTDGEQSGTEETDITDEHARLLHAGIILKPTTHKNMGRLGN